MRRDKTFALVDVPKSGLLARLRGRISREAAAAEVRNLLATIPCEQIGPGDIGAIYSRAGLTTQQASDDLIVIYSEAVEILGQDEEIDAYDRDRLAFLRRAFELTDEQAVGAEDRALTQIYRRAIETALEDGVFTADEKAHLEHIQHALGLAESRANEIYKVAAGEALRTTFSAAIADERYSANDEARVNAFAHALGLSLSMSDDTRRALERLRTLARIDDGDLPVEDADLLLQRGEVCHHQELAVMQKEMRTVTERINYSGPTASIKIVKGLRWRVGSVSVQRVRRDVLSDVGFVDVFLTNKRLVLKGDHKSQSVPLAKIIDFTIYSDGLQVKKGSGKDVFLLSDRSDWRMLGAKINALTTRASE